MMKKKLLVILACTALVPTLAQARDTIHFLDFKSVVAEATAENRLDGSVKFYLDAAPRNTKIITNGVTTSKKTNAFGKDDEVACRWVLQSALIHLQNSAKAAGANAVVNLVSNYNHKAYASADKYECHAGTLMAGVALKGDYATVR